MSFYNLEMGMGMSSFGSEFRYRQAATGKTDGSLQLRTLREGYQDAFP